MAFGSGNNSSKPVSSSSSSSHHHHHHHGNSTHGSVPGTSVSSLQQQKCSNAPPQGFSNAGSSASGYYDRDNSTNNVYQNHMFFQQTTSFKNQKQTFNPTGSTTGLLNSEFGDNPTQDNFFSQQYNQNNTFITHNSNRDLTPSERALLDQIRARKSELLKEIAQLQNEIDSVSRELLFKEDPPDLLNHRVDHPPLADVELDNLSEHSNNNDDIGNKIPSSSLLGSNSSSSSCKEKDRLKIMSLGCKKFNMDPKKGIEFLLLNALLKKEDEQDIAMFLYRGEGLNKTAIGDYLGEKSDFNEKVLKAFVALHDFTDLILVQALRQFLWSFRLPGEAQKIDRMMECFAQRYCQNNPDIFTNTDTCYVLSFAIIMLNTSLHNPSVKEKPTVDTFISMNRGINNGGDLPRELLISLYNSIQSEPFKIPEDDGNDLMHTFFNPDKEGWLWKQGGRYKTWKRRWFILNDNCLYYFEFTTDKEPRGIIPLENVNVRDIDDAKSKQKYCFELYATDGSEVIKACKTDSDGRVVEGKHSVYRMSAASSEERDSWVKALKQSISYSPFYEILRKSGAAANSTSSLRAGFGGKT